MCTTISVPSDNAEATRCQHHSPSRRRCRHARKDSRSRFCAAHDLLEQQRHDGDRCDAILGEPDPGHFDTAAGINHALTGLYVLLAEDRISPRRAAVLAYISSLQLRTLPVIEHETQRDAPVPRVVFDRPTPPRNDQPNNPGQPGNPDQSRTLEMPAHNVGVADPRPSPDPNAPHDPWDGWRPPKY
jgi:hypothetical protein